MTLNQVAIQVGSDVGNMSRIERGVQIPSRELAKKICALFPGELNELQLIYPNDYSAHEERGVVEANQTTDQVSA